MSKIYNQTQRSPSVLTVSDLSTINSDSSVTPKINWARMEEADNFAKTVKLYRQEIGRASCRERVYAPV